ncbi:hypothetical protein BPOR_0401g00010 [Botrytis porri]|uniref:Tc toxin complex TcA C-terminal TcB-binding domain-containing protein n=1 Tax=Botrytis porri TaxID=87229 RepID=A0A4Z1KNZ4_9HELO|nr:hypothetical protein BPOR_0401g00010 [Botrytis porri]
MVPIIASSCRRDDFSHATVGGPYTNLVAVLRDNDAFIDLRAILHFCDGLGNASDVSSKPLMTELFYLARPLLQLNSGDAYMEAAKNLRTRLTPSQREASDEGLMESRRETLVTFLLQQKFITEDLDIWDMYRWDHKFELRESRQLFQLYRCSFNAVCSEWKEFRNQYMRRIRSVSVSVPSNLETETDTNAVLTLLEHKYRVTQNAADYAASQLASGSEAFRTDRIPITAIAVSSGAKDPGVFELNLSGPRYMPFEGAGAISTWRLEFPAPIRHFNYESITDVQLHVQYTAYEGGPTLKKAAKDAVVQAAQTIAAQGQHQGYWALWDLNDFAGKWSDFEKTLLTPNVEAALEPGNLQDSLPFWSRHQKELQVQSFTLMSRNKNVRDRLSILVDPNTPAYNGTDGIYFGDFFTRQCEMTEKNLNWKLKAGAVPVAAVASENVYMFVRYIYVGKNIS